MQRPPVQRAAWLDRLCVVAWRALAHPLADSALWALCLLAAILCRIPSARGLLGADMLRWRWADGLWTPRPLRLATAVLGLLAGLRLLATAWPAWAPPPRRPRHMGEYTFVAADAGEALARLKTALAAAGLTTDECRQRDGVWLLTAWQRGRAHWLSSLAPLGLLVMLAGGMLQSALGWGSDPAPMLPGWRIALGPRTSMQAQLQVADSGSSRSLLMLWEGEQQVGAVHLGPWQPAFFRGLLLRQAAIGPALRLRARDASGAATALLPLTEAQSDDSLVYLRFSAAQQEQQVALPGANVVLRLVSYPSQRAASGDSYGDFLAEALSGRDGRLLESISFAQETGWDVGGLRVTLIPTRYLLLHVSRPVGMPLALAGLALGLVSLLARRWQSTPRLWMTLIGQEGRWRGQAAATCATLVEQIVALLGTPSDMS